MDDVIIVLAIALIAAITIAGLVNWWLDSGW